MRDNDNDDLMSSLFEGHDDILEDVQGDFALRLGETEMTVSDFTAPDTNPAILPLITNCKARWDKIRPSVIAALQGLGHSVVGDEVVTILKKFNFRVMEARGGSNSLKGIAFGECKVGDRVQMKGTPQFHGKITRIDKDGFAQLDTNRRIHIDQLEPKSRQSRGPQLPNFGDKTAAMPDSKGNFRKVERLEASSGRSSSPLERLLSEAESLLSEGFGGHKCPSCSRQMGKPPKFFLDKLPPSANPEDYRYCSNCKTDPKHVKDLKEGIGLGTVTPKFDRGRGGDVQLPAIHRLIQGAGFKTGSIDPASRSMTYTHPSGSVLRLNSDFTYHHTVNGETSRGHQSALPQMLHKMQPAMREDHGKCISCRKGINNVGYIDPETGMCQDCVGSVLNDYHSQGMHTNQYDERCPGCIADWEKERRTNAGYDKLAGGWAGTKTKTESPMGRDRQDHDEMDEEKPGCVCSECGRTVTHREYSSGATKCCKGGSVVPEEDFGKTYESRDVAEEMIEQFQRTGLAVVQEKAPPGFEGTVRAMKDETDIDNPYALAWWMKNKGYKSHKKADGSSKDESIDERNQDTGMHQAFLSAGYEQTSGPFKTMGDAKRKSLNQFYDHPNGDMGVVTPDGWHHHNPDADTAPATGSDAASLTAHLSKVHGGVREARIGGSSSQFRAAARKHGFWKGDEIDTKQHGPGEIWYHHEHPAQVFIFKDRAMHQAKGPEHPLFNNPESWFSEPGALSQHLATAKKEDYPNRKRGPANPNNRVGESCGEDDDNSDRNDDPGDENLPRNRRSTKGPQRYEHPPDKPRESSGDPIDQLLQEAGQVLGESMSRACHFFKATDGKHYVHLANREYGDIDDATSYGPFHSFEDADDYVFSQHSNPGSYTHDDSGKDAPPKKSPNGQPLVSPVKDRWGGWSTRGGGGGFGYGRGPRLSRQESEDNKTVLCPSCKEGTLFFDKETQGATCEKCAEQYYRPELVARVKKSMGESVAPGYLIPTQSPSNGERPDGTLTTPGVSPVHASLAMQDLHRRLGSALPELHLLLITTITDERTALGMLFNELHTAHCDIGNVLSYSTQVPDTTMMTLVNHYQGVVSQMLSALAPYMGRNPSVSRGPYRLGGALNDSK